MSHSGSMNDAARLVAANARSVHNGEHGVHNVVNTAARTDETTKTTAKAVSVCHANAPTVLMSRVGSDGLINESQLVENRSIPASSPDQLSLPASVACILSHALSEY